MKQLLSFLFFLLPFFSYSQLNETFSQSGVTSAYPWQGNVDQFMVNNRGELQLNAPEYKGKARLSISTTYLYENEWRFTVSSDYNGSSQNYVKIYLWCRLPDMDDPGEAIFIRLGYTKKSIALCHQVGDLMPKVLLEGRALFTNPARVEVKVVTDGQGQCTVYSKGTSETSYYTEGTVKLPVNDDSGQFMIGAVYSAGHSRDKYFDDIYIKRFTLGEEDPDDSDEQRALSPVRLEQINETTLDVWFDRQVNAEYASFILSSIGDAAEVQVSDDDKIVRLIWDTPLQKDKTYELNYSHLYDNEGIAYKGNCTFIATSGEDTDTDPDPDVRPQMEGYDYGVIRINEVMADPKGVKGLPETEYVELYNTSVSNIALKGWQFFYGDNTVSLPDKTLPGKGFAVLYREGRNIYVQGDALSLPLAKFPSQLANTGKILQLADVTGKTIDKIEYGKAQPGISWERSADGLYLSTDPRGGTPGSINSDPSVVPIPEAEMSTVEPQEIVFNELLPEPFVGGSEYIELYNRTEKELSLRGLSIAVRKSDGELGTRYPLDAVVRKMGTGEYVLLTREKTGVTDFYSNVPVTVLQEVKIPILANTSATLVLLRTEDRKVIDEVSYTSQWHASTVKDRKGIALERIDPDKPVQDPKNWTSATATVGYGTPGYQNSKYKAVDDGQPAGIDAPLYDKSTGEYIIRYEAYAYTNIHARVYDLAGRQVSIIANNELAGGSGQLVWNGTASDGDRLTPGVYILYVELYHLNGGIRKEKMVFLVH